MRPIALVAAASLLASAAAVRAQSDWDHAVFLYSWLTWEDGDSSLGPVETSVDVDVSELLDALEFAASARYRGQTEDWSVVVDAVYASFGARGEGPLRTDFDLNQYVLQADFGWRFSPESELFGGVRYVRLETEVKVRPPTGEIRHEADVSLWDPVVGLRTLRELRPRWLFQGQIDAGGGANMDFTWQAMAHVGYQPAERYGFWLGFRALGIDFDEGGASNRLSMDTVSYGPSLGVSMRL